MAELLGTTITDQPLLQVLISISLLLAIAWIGNWIAKKIVLRLFGRIASAAIGEEAVALKTVVRRLSNIVPAAIIGYGIAAVPHLPDAAVRLVGNLAAAFTILTVALAFAAAMDFANQLYMRRPDASMRPIKGYLQVAKIAAFCAAAVLIIASLIDRSPLVLLSGLGAMAAVIMLIFKDTILSLVASVQLTSNDMVRVGDWIEMPGCDADGDVIDIALHTVKVQNWDKTITTIPTHRLITDSFRNWRGMSESGGRRIKRALMIDQNSVRFLTPREIEAANRFAILKPYLERKAEEIAAWNRALPEQASEAVNARRVTNIGTFRAYVAAYLRSHERVSQAHTLMVRQLEPGPEGLPLEIYCFTSTTKWQDYETIQADIFDHLIAILPEFGLRLFQQPTGMDFSGLAPARAAA